MGLMSGEEVKGVLFRVAGGRKSAFSAFDGFLGVGLADDADV